MRESIVALRHLADHRSLFALVVVRGISSVGDWLYLAALPILVYQATDDVALVGMVAAGRLLPWLLLSIPAGVVADRYHTRAVLLVTEWSRAALMMIMAVLAAIDAPLWTILFAAVVAAGASTFAMPAFGRFAPDVAQDAEQLGRANVVASGLDSIACIVGPAVAAVLIVAGGLGLAFVLNGLTFVAVVGVLHRIRATSRASHRETSADARPSRRSGVRWSVLFSQVIRPLALDAAVSFAAGLLMVLPVIALAAGMGTDDVFAGVLSVASGIGGIAGAGVAAAFVNARLGRGISLAVVSLVVGLLTVGLGTAPVLVVSGAVVSAAAVVALDTLNLTQVQRTLDADMLGRGLGLINTSAAFWVILGSLLPTLLVEALGLPFVILGSAILLAILGGVAVCPMPRLTGPGRVPRPSDTVA